MKSIKWLLVLFITVSSSFSEDSLPSISNLQLAYCSQWEEQCTPDIIYEDKVNCTQHCVQYVNEPSTSVESQPFRPVNWRGTIVGLIIVGLVVYWCSTFR